MKKLIKYPFNYLNTNILKPRIWNFKYREILGKNRALKNTKRGKRCFILGTGPSILKQDLLRLQGEEVFVVNNFWHHPQYLKLHPNYYVITDPTYFPQNQEKTFLGDDLLKRDEVINKLPTKLFFNLRGKEFIQERGLYKNNEIYYLGIIGFFRSNHKFNLEIDKVIPEVKNVVLGCLIIAVYMGFEEIYLLGCEHDFFAHPRFYEGFKHFYEEKKRDSTNAEEARYYNLNVQSYEDVIESYRLTFRNYRLFKEKIAQTYPRVKIYNATPNSFLDVFPFVKYEDLVL